MVWILAKDNPRQAKLIFTDVEIFQIDLRISVSIIRLNLNLLATNKCFGDFSNKYNLLDCCFSAGF